MVINFETLKKQNLSKELLFDILEQLYNCFKADIPQNIIINEYVENMKIINDKNIYQITLSNNPVSINDIFIVTEDGEIIVTPKNITELSSNVISFQHNKIKNKVNFFVTYKY